MRDTLGRHGEAHILGPIDELEDRRSGLVFFFGLDAEDACVASRAGGIAFSELVEEFGEVAVGLLNTEEGLLDHTDIEDPVEDEERTYKKYCLRALFTRIGVSFPQRDQLFGQPLSFFGFVPCRRDGLVLDERCDEISEEGFAVR